MSIEQTRQAIDTLVRNRGEKAKRIWTVMGGYQPRISPTAALENLEKFADSLRAELVDEANQLAKDIRKVLENPPIPR